MKPYARSHDVDRPGLRDYYACPDLAPARWPRVVLVLAILLALVIGIVVYARAQDGGEAPNGQPRSSLGTGAPVCNAVLIATGTLTQSPDGSYAVGDATLTVHPNGIPTLLLKHVVGRRIDLLIRDVKPLRSGERTEP